MNMTNQAESYTLERFILMSRLHVNAALTFPDCVRMVFKMVHKRLQNIGLWMLLDRKRQQGGSLGNTRKTMTTQVIPYVTIVL